MNICGVGQGENYNVIGLQRPQKSKCVGQRVTMR